VSYNVGSPEQLHSDFSTRRLHLISGSMYVLYHCSLKLQLSMLIYSLQFSV